MAKDAENHEHSTRSERSWRSRFYDRVDESFDLLGDYVRGSLKWWVVGTGLVVLSVLVFCLFWGRIGLYLLEHWAEPVLSAPEPLCDPQYTPCDIPKKRFFYGSLGNEGEGLPEDIWNVLPAVCPRPGAARGEPFATTEKLYDYFGLIEGDRRGQPIGFSKRKVTLEFSLFGVPIFRGMEGVRVNLNCALCHTATYRTTENDKPIVVPGAPAHQLRADEALRFLRECAKGLTARKIINAKGNLSWRERLRYYLVVPPLRRKILDSPEQAAFAKTHPWGPGRFDALNGSKIRVLGMPYDESRGVADMPAVWRLNPNHARNWDGNHLSLTEAIRAEALATGTPKSALDKVVDDVSSVRCEDPEASTDSYGKREGKPIDEELLCLKRYLQSLSPPRFPFAPTNEAEGKRLFLEHCANCHAEHNGRPTRVGTVIPLEAIGTDPSRLRAWSPEAVKEKNELGKGHAWRISQSRKTEGYVAVPLDGIWLRAPYLHNGAVPTLRDLLEDPKDRPPAFCRGYDVIDFKDVGFFSNFVIKGRCEKEEREFSVFDTSKPGNGNGGHVFGTQLSPEEKGRLLEYLKTL